MKPLKFFALVGIITTISIVLPAVAEVRQQALFGQSPNYVVIGAFAVQKNAVKFTNHASDLHLSARYELNPNRNLYYVYVLSTDDRDQAIREAVKLRSETEFTDTWVYTLSSGKKISDVDAISGVDIHPVTKDTMENVPSENGSVLPSPNAGSNPAGQQSGSNAVSMTYSSSSLVSGLTAQQNPTSTPQMSTGTKSSESKEVSDDSSVASPSASTSPDNSNEISGKSFVFNIYRSVDNSSIEGDVDVIDAEKSRKVGTYKANAPVRVSSPGNKSGDVSLVCEVFGYRKLQKDINYQAPEGEGITREGETFRVPFELVRLQKGDIAVMYNVYFFKDAGVMRPESRYEVNSLLEMLKENPNYKIKIHGHTNGGSHGKIISIGDSENFFSLTGTKEGFGSAKKLSEERATVIQKYLTSNGIDPKRTQVKAWGGKRPIHDKHSTRANENVRVEIEIIED